MSRLSKRLNLLEQRVDGRNRPQLSEYRDDPLGYVREVLRIKLSPQQQVIASAILKPPYRVKVPSGHNVGKTFLAAAIVNWWYDTRNPSACITTAPTERDVVDLLWTEIRLQRQRVQLPSDFVGPRAPEMRTSEEHYAKGYTARKGESFQGRHRENMLFVFDEDEGVDAAYWRAAETMFKSEPGNAWLCIGNPTTTDSTSALEELALTKEGQPKWKIINLSSLEHPNIEAGLAKRPPPIPAAVSLAQVEQWLQDWCSPIPKDSQQPGDIEWPPGSQQWLRPGPIAEARVLGRRPTGGSHGVWSPLLWSLAENSIAVSLQTEFPEIGCDVARFGDDWTVIHARWGPCSIWHERHNGWNTAQTASRLKELAQGLAVRLTRARDSAHAPIKPNQIRVKIDDDGVGGGVVDQGGPEYCFIPISAAATSTRPDDFPNKRSELWFALAEKARAGRLCLTDLLKSDRDRLRLQALTPTWKLDTAGRRVVEKKENIKKRLGFSPDDMDAMNLAYFEAADWLAPIPIEIGPRPKEEDVIMRRGLYGAR